MGGDLNLQKLWVYRLGSISDYCERNFRIENKGIVIEYKVVWRHNLRGPQ